MIEAQLVTGATHDRRIFTGSAPCAAPALKSAAAARLATIHLDRRMGFLLLVLFTALGRFTRNVAERRRFWQAPIWRTLGKSRRCLAAPLAPALLPPA